MSISEDLRARATAWMADDPDPAARDELTALIEEGDAEGLATRFEGPLTFGTAGLRGLLGAGESRMNRKVVRRATAGLLAYVAREVEGARERGLAIGYDGRKLSREMAEDAARVALGAGFRVFLSEGVMPTPVLAFACLDRNAAAGIVVTASHNPPAYNGYKVYWENGAQIIPPHDAGIATAIDAVPSLDQVPLGDVAAAHAEGRLEWMGEALDRRYLDGVAGLRRDLTPAAPLSIAYTALHGVGSQLCLMALREAGHEAVFGVDAQAEPDGTFPTVAFPNPEEKGAMDLVLALGEEKQADLIIANDPDADRLAAAVRQPEGGYRVLNGNEVGCLLADYLLRNSEPGPDRLVVNTIVSSPMLGAIAKRHRARFEQTLTGFKWIANQALALSLRDGARFILGYEEALGYTVGTLVRDKDGIGAAVVMAELAARTKAEGKTLIDALEVLWRDVGIFLSRQVAVTKPGAEGKDAIAAIMASVRADPPPMLGERAVTARVDLASGERRALDGSVTKVELPPGDVLLFELEGGHRVMLRPSGTEPKIKYYFDVRVEVGEGEPIGDARARGEAELNSLEAALLARVDASGGSA